MKDDTVYIDHINESLRRISKYVFNHDKESFLQSQITQDAVIRQLEIIGEATKQISKEFRSKHTEIPWEDMAGMRDKLIHDYIGVDLWVVWRTVESDVPELMKLLEQIQE